MQVQKIEICCIQLPLFSSLSLSCKSTLLLPSCRHLKCLDPTTQRRSDLRALHGVTSCRRAMHPAAVPLPWPRPFHYANACEMGATPCIPRSRFGTVQVPSYRVSKMVHCYKVSLMQCWSLGITFWCATSVHPSCSTRSQAPNDAKTRVQTT